MSAGHRPDDLPDLTNHFGSARNAKAARRKHGSSLIQHTNPNATTISPAKHNTGLFTPPSSQNQTEMDARRMLISPPPEEFLRRNRAVRSSSAATTSPQKSTELGAKRKRQTSATTLHDYRIDMMSGGGESTAVDSNVAEATPSGKPRKQSKRHVDFVPRDSSPTRPSSSTAQLSATTPTRSSHNLSRSPTKRVFLLSPHQANPKADYAPLSPSHRRERISARRRSVTPIFPYEPPPERFTPPREVLCSPPQESPTRSRGNRRKSVQSAKGTRRLTLTIKKEPPVIDLSRPLPPPSPTDDPLLLSGPPRRRKSRACPSEARPVTPPHASVSHCFDDSLDADIRAVTYSLDGSSHSHSRDTPILASSPPARPQDDEDAPLPELLMAQSAQAALSHHGFTDDEEPQAGSDPIPIFSFNALDAASDDDWSDDPREEVAGVEVDGFEEGEYTGKFRMVAVPTKADPPSSCTRMRMDAWGRPKSPHPRLAVLREGSESPAENDEMGGAEDVPVDTELELAPAQAVEFEVEGESVPSTDHEEPDQADGEPSPAPDDAEGVSIFNPLDLAIDESSRTPSPPPNELATPLAEQDGADILMDDASDQDTLTEPEPDLTDDLITHLHSKGKEPAIVTSEFSLGSSSTAATEQPVEVEGFTEFLVPLRDDEDDWDAPSSEPPIQIHAESEGEENDEEDEEDCSDEAIVDRELSILPGDESEEEDEGAARVTEHASSGPFDLSKAESNYAPVKETQSAVDDDDDDLAGSSDEESEALDDGVIKITSDDPLAAARAAAILRLHDYDCVPRVLARKRRHSHLDVPSAMRDARRRSSTASGISKAAASTPKRRHTLGGMVGDKVIIPGSPALTIPELLKEAERSLQLEEESVSPHKLVSPRNAFVTPTKPAESFSWATSDFSASILSMGEGETAAGAWTRKDWKRLDSCLTDERLARGVGGGLADAESVDLEKVVDRFFAQLQRPSTALGHAALSRDDVLRRTRALQKKQQSGRVAPPTPSSVSMLSQVPDASSKREKSQAPEQRPCSHVVVSAPNEHKAPHVQRKADAGLQRPTFTTRVKGFFYSYLPVASGSKTHTVKKPQPTQPGLPVPPPETFAKPRPPIHTPASKPIPKPVPPKDTIQLNSVLPPKPSRIPRSKEPPRRLVELHPLPPPPSENLLRVNPPGNRRSSGGSVKDLILTFEGLGESRNSRPSSVASHRGGSKLKERPLWRP